MSQTQRLYWIDGQIRARRYPNADAVSAHFGVSRRTAFADRDHLLTGLEAPLKYDRQHGGWFYTDLTFVLPFLALSEPEAVALRRSVLAAQEYLSGADADAAHHLLERLAPYLRNTSLLSAWSESMGGSIRHTEQSQVASALLDVCRQAVHNRQRLQLRYHGAHRDETRERIVCPYHLHNDRGEWHLIGWCEWRQDVRQFFLGRVQSWQLLEGDAAFVRDAGFDLDAYLRQGLGAQHGTPVQTVQVRFSSFQARWIRERQYHASQQIEEEPGGSLLLTMQVAGLDEVRRWLLSFGADAEVLQPRSLREEIAAHAKKLTEIYAETSE